MGHDIYMLVKAQGNINLPDLKKTVDSTPRLNQPLDHAQLSFLIQLVQEGETFRYDPETLHRYPILLEYTRQHIEGKEPPHTLTDLVDAARQLSNETRAHVIIKPENLPIYKEGAQPVREYEGSVTLGAQDWEARTATDI